MVSDRLFDRACEDLQTQTKKVFELEKMNKALLARVARLEEALRFILDECDWKETMLSGGGDNRIGDVARRALEGKGHS